MYPNNDIEFYEDKVHSFANALDEKDPYTFRHSTRVGDMAYELAMSFGLNPAIYYEIHFAGHLHDIGKINIPDSILCSHNPLSSEEWNIIKEHSRSGSEILKESERLKDTSLIVPSHHKRWDGIGYPDGLLGAIISFGSRIIAIYDIIDAMTSTRPYRETFSWEDCYKKIKNKSGSQFDPDIIKFLNPIYEVWKKRYKTNSNDTKQ